MKSTVANLPGEIRAIDMGNGIYELRKEPDVLCITPMRKRKRNKVLFMVGTLALFIGTGVALVCIAPPVAVITMALVAWCGFASACGKE